MFMFSVKSGSLFTLEFFSLNIVALQVCPWLEAMQSIGQCNVLDGQLEALD